MRIPFVASHLAATLTLALGLAAFGAPAVAADAPSAPTTPSPSAEPVVMEAAVTYVAGHSVYVSAGRRAGVVVGDTLWVMHGDLTIAWIIARDVSSTSSACDTIRTREPIQVGAPVRFIARAETAPPQAGVVPAGESTLVVPASTPVATPVRRARVHGRVGVGYQGVETGATHMVQPSLDVRADAVGYAGGHVDAGVDARGRRTVTTTSSTSDVGALRVYRAAVSWHATRGGFRATAGRQFSSAYSSASLFDGLALETGSGRLGAGAFIGTEPDPVNLGWSSQVFQSGAFVEARGRPGAAVRSALQLGAISSSVGGVPNRDAIFLQGFLFHPRASVNVLEEADVNRGWRRSPGDPVITPSTTYINGRVDVMPGVAVRAGYDGRRDVRLYRDRETPETEFDDHARQGGWGGVTYSRFDRLRLDGDVRIRTGAPDDRSLTWTGAGDVGPYTGAHVRMRARWSTFTSDGLNTRLASMGFGLDPGWGTHVEVNGGVRGTADRVTGSDGPWGHWYSAGADVAVLARAYLSGTFDLEKDGDTALTQVALTLSWRF